MSVIGQVEQHEIDAYLGDSKADMTAEQYADFCSRVREVGPDGDWETIAREIFGDSKD